MHQTEEYPFTVNKSENKRAPRYPAEVLPLEVGYLPPYFQKKAEIELHETPEKIQKGIRLLRKMMEKDKSFQGQKFDDNVLTQMLRFGKHDIAKAFKRFQNFVNFKRRNLKLFTDVRIDLITLLMRKNVLTLLPRRCHEGCAIFRIEGDCWEPDELPVEILKQAFVVMISQSLRDPMTQVNGFKVIFNVKSDPMKHLRFCTPSNLYMLYYGPTKNVAARFKELHLLNRSFTFDVGYMFLKPFLNQKTKQMLVFHPSPETLPNYFPRAALPVEYGGELEKSDLDTTDWLRRVTQPDKSAIYVWEPAT